MKKILLFGADSFTGKHLLAYLSNKDYNVFGTTVSPSDSLFQCDITDKGNVKTILEEVMPDYIINLTGISSITYPDKELFYKVNLFGVENILKCIIEINNYSPKKIILPSSAYVYGNQEQSVLDETICPNPNNHYSLSKYAMEQIAKTYFRKINIIITRPFNYTGPAQEETFIIPKIVLHFKTKKNAIELGSLDVIREFNDIHFVCEVYEKLLLSESCNIIVNICSGRGIKLKEIINYLRDLTGYHLDVIENKCFFRDDEVYQLVGSTTRLFQIIGEVKQKDFKETLIEMLKS